MYWSNTGMAKIVDSMASSYKNLFLEPMGSTGAIRNK